MSPSLVLKFTTTESPQRDPDQDPLGKLTINDNPKPRLEKQNKRINDHDRHPSTTQKQLILREYFQTFKPPSAKVARYYYKIPY